LYDEDIGYIIALQLCLKHNCTKSSAALGSEVNSEISRCPRHVFYQFLERRIGVQCHHQSKQVIRKKSLI